MTYKMSQNDLRRAEEFMYNAIEISGCEFADIEPYKGFTRLRDVLSIINSQVRSVLSGDDSWENLGIVKKFLLLSQEFTCVSSRNGYEILHSGVTRDFYELSRFQVGPYISFGCGYRDEITVEDQLYILNCVDWRHLLREGRYSIESNRLFEPFSFELVSLTMYTLEGGTIEIPQYRGSEKVPELIGGEVVFINFEESVDIVRRECKELINLREILAKSLEQAKLGVNLYINDIHIYVGNNENHEVNISTIDLVNAILKRVLINAKASLDVPEFWEQDKYETLDYKNYIYFYEDLDDFFDDDLSERYLDDLRRLRQMKTTISDLLRYKDLYIKYDNKPMTVLNPVYKEGVRITGLDLSKF